MERVEDQPSTVFAELPLHVRLAERPHKAGLRCGKQPALCSQLVAVVTVQPWLAHTQTPVAGSASRIAARSASLFWLKVTTGKRSSWCPLVRNSERSVQPMIQS